MNIIKYSFFFNFSSTYFDKSRLYIDRDKTSQDQYIFIVIRVLCRHSIPEIIYSSHETNKSENLYRI